MDRSFFEMQDLRKRKLDKSVWVPLRGEKSVESVSEIGTVGYSHEFSGYGSIMLPMKNKSMAAELDWTDIGCSQIHCFNYLSGKYSPSDKFENVAFDGVFLVLNQNYDNNFDNNEWHLHQDLVLNLGLKREGDIWVCPRIGYVEVAKLERDADGSPVLLQIKNQFLKDYLNARDCGLYVASYHSRDEIFNTNSELQWCSDSGHVIVNKDVWECRVLEIHEGGFPFGQSIAISHSSRTDVNENDDVPEMISLPSNDNVEYEFSEKKFDGDKLYRPFAELWKYDWINPGATSPIALGEDLNIDIFYIVDSAGNKQRAMDLKSGGKWLWFKPELARTLLEVRGGFLKWYTKNTGSISCAPAYGVHFGVNDLGLIIVYAEDVAKLPIWQQQNWVVHNIAPDGGLPEELYEAQVKAKPALTSAPENYIAKVIDDINEVSLEELNLKFFRGHNSVEEILETIHRFRAVDDKGLFSLAKDIARVIVDDIDVDAINKFAAPPSKGKLGSLKTVQNLLAIKIGAIEARKLLSPLVGVYELRHGDAHLPGSEIENSFKLIDIDRSKPTIIQGYQLIHMCVTHLHYIQQILMFWNVKKDFQTEA